ncbi:MAG: hypothetical protein J3R72DRAFT_430574 [Linnemannia gamsii]|nr:MAG: hypothetical protein J3R72DRAFT_430574 [Linnemannia gamsii]
MEVTSFVLLLLLPCLLSFSLLSLVVAGNNRPGPEPPFFCLPCVPCFFLAPCNRPQLSPPANFALLKKTGEQGRACMFLYRFGVQRRRISGYKN